MRVIHRNVAVAAVMVLACLAGLAAVLVGGRTGGSRIENTAVEERTDTVTFQGVGNVHFGDSTDGLTREHGLVKDPTACTGQLSDIAGIDPVVADGKLVLMWVHAPVHTPEGIAEGSPVSAVRAAYADGRDLTPPAGSHAYPGILVVRDDKAFLFLHDGQTVRKEIAGYADYVQRLYSDGFGAC